MPPSLPRTASICAFRGPVASTARSAISITGPSSRCVSALFPAASPAQRQPQRHQFGTTPAAAGSGGSSIPPESPKYITVPEAPQSSEVRQPPVRGHLPVPRQVFSKRDGARKLAPGYVEATTPRSRAEAAGEPPRNELEAWRRRMTESRRRALAAGLKGLYRRKERADRLARERGTARFEANRRAALAPEGLDDVLTRSSVPGIAELSTEQVPDPDRFAKAEAAAERTAARQQARSEARRDALAELYIASRDFIVTEEELEREVDRIFTDDFFRQQGSVAVDSSNIWDARGPPISIAGMLSASNHSQSSIITAAQAGSTKTAKRQKTVAEELTGGKMP